MFTRRTACPACSGHNSTELYRTAYSDADLAAFMAGYYSAVDSARQRAALQGASFVIRRCDGCSLIYQEEIPNDQLLADLYGNWLGKNDPLAPHKPPMPMDYYTYMAQEVMQIVAFLQRRHGTSRRLRFLDFGMGWGNWAQMAAAFGVEVYGVELSPEKAERARALGIQVLLETEIAHQHFDFINTEQVIEHLVAPRDAVSRLRSCLAPGGLLKVSVPDGSGIESVLRSWKWRAALDRRDDIMPVQPLEHLNCFQPASLRRLGELCNLRDVAIPLSTTYAYSTDWSSARQVARNVLRPIKRFIRKRGCYVLFESA